MAVFTDVSVDDAARLASALGLGAVRALKPITSGIENTNYFLTAERGDYVLTLFERLTADEVPFYLHLMKHLAQRGLPVPEPQADGSGEILHTLHGKPAAVVVRLVGTHVLAPGAAHCAAVGRLLARMHLAAADFPRHQPNLRGLAWAQATVPGLLPFLGADQRALLTDELRFQQAVAASPEDAALPRAAVHADLFRDNVLFHEPAAGRLRLSGVFDFYFAGVDRLAFDLAVCLNDWCIDLHTGRLLADRATALVDAYAAVRPLGADEVHALPALLRAAALRFWVSRLADLHQPRQASALVPHDPAHFERVLRERIAAPWQPGGPA